MTPQAALIELLGRVGASQRVAVLVNDDELNQWPAEAIKAMKSQRLIAKARPASSVICSGCERDCVMPVHTIPAETGVPESFIICDKRSDINRVPVPTERLSQWQCSADLVCGFVAANLGLRRSARQTGIADLWEIGIAFGGKRSQMLCLKGNGALTLVAGNNGVPLADVIEYHDGAYLPDGSIIRKMVDSATTADPRYTPNNAKREARKLDTQAMHESWRKAFRSLRKQHRNKSDTWYSIKIAKMDIAQGRNSETIRKKMKK